MIKAAHNSFNYDNSRHLARPPALPKSFGLDEHRYVTKTRDQRIIEKDMSRKTSRVSQRPGWITGTEKRETFKRSDQAKRAANVQEICNGYSNQKERDACQKRYGVHTEKTQDHAKSRIAVARERCAKIQ